MNFKINAKSQNKNFNKINSYKRDGKSICGYAATSKSTTILNYCNINSNHIDYICDTTKEKIGKFSPGMHIPIKNMDYFRKTKLIVFIYLLGIIKKKFITKKKILKENGFRMLSYKNRIVFTGGSGRFASAFKSVEKQSKYKFFFPKKIELNILKIETIKRYLKSKKPKYLIHLAGLSRPMNIHQKDIKQSIDKNIIGTAILQKYALI